MLAIIFNLFLLYINMFYSSNGKFFNKVEHFEPSLDKVNVFKEDIKYSSLEVTEKSNIDSLIEYVVNEANNLLNEYSSIENEAERNATKIKIHNDLLINKTSNNIYVNLQRMTMYNGGEEFLDKLYLNQLSLFNSILNVDNWKINSVTINQSCKNLKEELTSNFEEYNKSKSIKTDALLKKSQVEKQLIEAQDKINIAINNINTAANNYNNILVKLHNSNCGT